jgi:hypothetical protein
VVSYSSALDVSRARIEKSVFQVLLVYLVLHAILILAVPLLPFIDLPNHLAEATIFKYYDDPESPISKYYEPIPWFYPNTFHAVFAALFPSVELGNKVFHILYILLLQGGLFLLIRKLNGNQWFGLLGLVYTYNYNLTFGFVGFAISIPALLLLVYFILLDFEQEKLKWKIIISIILLVLYSMHAQNALLGLLIYGVMLLVRYWPNLWKAVITGVPVALPLVALIFTWWMLKEDSEKGGTFEFLVDYYQNRYLPTVISRFNVISWDSYSLFARPAGRIAGTLFSATLIVPFIYFRAWKKDFRKILASPEFRYPAVGLLVAMGCYFLLPDELPGQSPLYQRFCTMVMLFGVIVLSVWLRGYESRFLRVFSISVLVIYSVLWADYLITFNRINDGFNASFFPDGDKEARISGLIWENDFRDRKVYIHFQNYFVVWKKGVASSKIIDYRFGIVRRVAPESVVPFYHEYAMDEYTDEYLYNDIEYLLAREPATPKTTKYFPAFEKVHEKSGWTLYRNTRPRRQTVP